MGSSIRPLLYMSRRKLLQYRRTVWRIITPVAAWWPELLKSSHIWGRRESRADVDGKIDFLLAYCSNTYWEAFNMILYFTSFIESLMLKSSCGNSNTTTNTTISLLEKINNHSMNLVSPGLINVVMRASVIPLLCDKTQGRSIERHCSWRHLLGSLI